jgi:hypothetical protein
MMYHGDSRPDDQDADAAMMAMYRELDQRDLPSDPAFDLEAGLQDLTGRMQRETSRSSEPAPIGQRERLRAYGGTATEPIWRELQGENELTRLAYSHELELAARSSRTSTVFFAGISAMAVAATVLVTVPHLASFAAVVAIAVINATTAAAGAVVYRTSTLVRRTADAVRRRARARPDLVGPVEHSPWPGTATGDTPPADLPGNATCIHIEQFNGTLTLADSQRPPAGASGRPHHRAVSAVLALLTAATAVAAIIGIVGMLNQGPLTGYEITLITSTATSILLLLTTWWWRTTDHESGLQREPSAAITRDACVALLRAAGELRILAENMNSYRGDTDGIRARLEELQSRAEATRLHAAEVSMLVPARLAEPADQLANAASNLAADLVRNTSLDHGVLMSYPDVTELVRCIAAFRDEAVRHAAD